MIKFQKKPSIGEKEAIELIEEFEAAVIACSAGFSIEIEERYKKAKKVLLEAL